MLALFASIGASDVGSGYGASAGGSLEGREGTNAGDAQFAAEIAAMQAADAVSQSIVAFVTTIQSAIEKALNWLAPDNSTPANNALVGTSFDLVNWMLVGTVDESSPRTFNAGTTIGLLASSNAGPLPTNQFSFLVKALQSDENANLIPSMTENGDPSKSYSSGFTGLASGNQFVIEAQPPNATSNWQWSVSLPIAGPTHDNALNNTVTIYVPRGSQ